MPADRKVARVLVMVEYGPGDPDSGEVFDLTALVEELREKMNDSYSQHVWLRVNSEKTWFNKNQPRTHPDLTIGWSTNYGPSSGHLEDALNVGLPDGERVTGLRTKATKLRKAAEKLDYDAKVAKMEQVAAVRHLHPIARVTPSTTALPDVAEGTK